MDDNHDAADMLAMALTDLGYTTQIAYDGPSALDAVKRGGVDVVFLDIGLPTMDGYEVARQLRADRSLARVWIIALTGYGQAEDRARAHDAGCDDHVVKPLELAQIPKVLARIAR